MFAVLTFDPALLRSVQFDSVTSAANAQQVTSDKVPADRMWYTLGAQVRRSAELLTRNWALRMIPQSASPGLTLKTFFSPGNSVNGLEFPLNIILIAGDSLNGLFDGAAPVDGGTLTIDVRYLELRVGEDAQDRVRAITAEENVSDRRGFTLREDPFSGPAGMRRFRPEERF